MNLSIIAVSARSIVVLLANVSKLAAERNHQVRPGCHTNMLEGKHFDKYTTVTKNARIQPPYGDVDDRIRSIAHALNLTTAVWTYDSNDWKVGTGNITNATVDANYESLAAMATNGTFATVIFLFTPSSHTKWILNLVHRAAPSC